jgi:hypothetical protein
VWQLFPFQEARLLVRDVCIPQTPLPTKSTPNNNSTLIDKTIRNHTDASNHKFICRHFEMKFPARC